MRLSSKLIWAPTLNYHDPEPPFPLVDEGVQFGLLDAQGDAVGTFSGATVLSATLSIEGDSTVALVGTEGNAGAFSMQGDSEFNGESAAGVSGTFLMEGDSTLSAVGEEGNAGVLSAQGDSAVSFLGINLVESEMVAEGDSTFSAVGAKVIGASFSMVAGSFCGMTGSKRSVASGDFTYIPASLTVAPWPPRREPEITIEKRVDGQSVNTMTYTIGDTQPLTGQHVTAEFTDTFEHFHGPIVRVDQGYETGGEVDQLIWDALVSDYTFHLNRRVPFGCFEDESISDIVETLMDDFAPGFTYTVEAGLPLTSIYLDGTQSMTEVLSHLAVLANAHSMLDVKHLRFFSTDPTEQPDVIDDNNPDLLRDPQVRSWEDIRQLRNCVFGKGIEVTVTAEAAPGASSLLIEGSDEFEDGDAIIVNGQIIKYGGRESNEIVLDAQSVPAMGSFGVSARRYDDLSTLYAIYASHPTIQSEAFALGRIKGRVDYYVSILDTYGESLLIGPVTISSASFQPFRYGSAPPGILGITANEGSAQAWEYLFVWRMVDGQVSTSLSPDTPTRTFMGGATTPGLTFNNVPVSAYPHVKGLDVYRKKAGTFYLVKRILNGTTTFFENASDDNLLIPFMGDTDSTATVGIQPRLTGIPTGGHARKVYRQEDDGPTRLVHTINDGTTDEYIDNKPFAVAPATPAQCPPLDYDQGGGTTPEGLPVWAVQEEGEEPPPVPKIIQMRLKDIPPEGEGSIHCLIKPNSKGYLWVEVNDLEAQIELALREGEDGVHQFTIPEVTVTTRVELIRRCQAELVLFARPIKGVVYATRDRKHKPGKWVPFNLTNPPIVGTFKIQDVKVDQIHIDGSEELVERYTCTATSVLFTIDDILRRMP